MKLRLNNLVRRYKELEALLKWYSQEIGSDLIAVLVVNRDGLIIESISGKSEGKVVDEEIVGGVTGLVEPVLTRITKEFSSGAFGTGTFDTEDYRLIFCEAGPDAVFVTVLDAMAMIDRVFSYVYLTAEKIARIFDGRSVSPVIPKIMGVDTKGIERKKGQLQKISVQSGEYAFKLILGGEGGVGKTSMVHRFVENSFASDYKSTIGTSIMKKECNFEGLGSKVRFVIWDLAGQSQFKRVRMSYVENAEAGLLVFDTTRKETYDKIEEWYNESKTASSTISLILVGNKVDLEDDRQVTTEEGQALAQKLGLTYIETSAKTGENINDAFKILALQMIKKYVVTEEI